MSKLDNTSRHSDGNDNDDDDKGPTSTTKALLISVFAPRRFCPVIAEDEPEAEDENTVATAQEENESSNTGEESPEDDTKDLELVYENEIPFGTLAETRTLIGDDASSPLAPLDSPKNISTYADPPPPITAAQKTSVEAQDERIDLVDDQGVLSDNEEAVEAEIDIKRVSAENSKTEELEEEEEEVPVTAEEAAAVTVGEEPNETEVNFEELLRIAFKALQCEWHFLNTPTFIYVHNKTEGLEDDWIRVDVMARVSSVGIIMERLERIGVGTDAGTVTIFKAELCRTASPYAHRPKETSKPEERKESPSLTTDEGATSEKKSDGVTNQLLIPPIRNNEASENNGVAAKSLSGKSTTEIKKEREIEAAKAEWMNAATRLRIEQVREQIVEQAAFSFDFIALVIIASILAGVGLATNNTVVIVASMLVSPIMGPVLGMTFGGRIRDWPLARSSFKVEIYALGICIFVGVSIALTAGFTDSAELWPTNEMQIRGDVEGLYTGIAIAIPSGMGVSLSILGGNTGSLVGVAISASLLPPAVNAGICWMYAILVRAGVLENAQTASELAVTGTISFVLTVLNIACIWVAGMLMFAIKEVAPTKKKNAFWSRDVQVARELNTKAEGEQPPPVDISVLRRGLSQAVDSGRAPDVVKKSPGQARWRGKRAPTRPLNIAPPLYPTRESRVAFGSTAFAPAGYVRVEPIEEGKFGEEEDDNVRYVGLQDMGRLLGFDDEEDVSIDSAAIANHLGYGHYL
uniref:TIGR00341 family protein n=1 Tax=Attheya septentrionalis TaxID=420275 RepID=A0A7S2XSZ6_9STRA|mmetsp:Transcript_880/g.1640  ORF Transcript_880/g.1640 Transcript_880/m.1640 type:complete len:748 (+) Transcript_880:80-2323(+)